MRAGVSGGALYFVERRTDGIGRAVKLDGLGNEVYATEDVLPALLGSSFDELLFEVGHSGRVAAGTIGQITLLDAAGQVTGLVGPEIYRQARWTPLGTLLTLGAGVVAAYAASGALLWSRPRLGNSIEIAPTSSGGARVFRILPIDIARVDELAPGGAIVDSVVLPVGSNLSSVGGTTVSSVVFTDPGPSGEQWCSAQLSATFSSLVRVSYVAVVDVDSSVACDAAAPGSSGELGRIAAIGDGAAAADDVVLYADGLPPGQTTLFLNSRTLGSTPMVGGGLGTLCLGGSINRYVRPGELSTSSDLGVAWLPLTLSSTPDGATTSPVLAGETWYYQAWHRDVVGGVQTSNLTGAVAVTYR